MSEIGCPICEVEWKNLENRSKSVENAFKNDLKLSRMHLRTSRIELKTSRIDSNLENRLIFEMREDHSQRFQIDS